MRAPLRRVACETRRHLARSATLKLATATAVFATVLAWLQGGGLEAPIFFTYYLLPMLASPYAAYLVTKDRRQATTQVLETSPTIRSERLLAQATATIAAPALAIVATTPVLYGLAPQRASLLRSLPVFFFLLCPAMTEPPCARPRPPGSSGTALAYPTYTGLVIAR
jgi:hypothetical protein